jgi:outer membrane murein-binding lipoprotein Lpp
MTDRELLQQILEKVDSLNAKVDGLDTKVDDLDTKVNGLDTKVSCLDTKVSDLDAKVDRLDTEVSGIKLHIENVIEKNIRTIAEGHIDLSRKLNEVIHIASDIRAYHEIQDILVREHDEKLKKII